MKQVLKVTNVLRMVCESSARNNSNVITSEIGNAIEELVSSGTNVLELVEMIESLDIDMLDKADVLEYVWKCDEYLTDEQEVKRLDAILRREAQEQDPWVYNCHEHFSH